MTLKDNPGLLIFPPQYYDTQSSASNICLFVFLAVLWYCVYYCFCHPLADYPGPWLAKITNLWRFYHYFQGSLHLVDHALFQQYDSPVVRVGPDKIIFSGPEAFKAIHGNHPNIERGDFYIMTRFPDRTERSVFSAETNVLHKEKRRKLVAAAFSPSVVNQYEPVITKHVVIWASALQTDVANANARAEGVVIDIALLNKALSTDCLFEILTGEPVIGAMKIRHTERFRKAMQIRSSTQRLGFGFGLVPFIPLFFMAIRLPKWRFRHEKYDKNGNPLERTLVYWSPLKRLETVLLPHERSSSPSKKPSVLANMVTRGLHSDDEIITEITNLTFAGTGTLAAGLTSLLYDLAARPEWQHRIRDEMFNSCNIPSEPGKVYSLRDTSFLNAFIYESYRLSPPDGSPFERTIFPGAESAVPGCYGALPPGTVVGSALYTVNRDHNVFGADADDFRPQRWLEASPETLRVMRESWAVFGRGSKACPGHRIALMLLTRCVHEVLSRWDLEAAGKLMGRNNFEMSYDKAELRFRPRQ